MTLTVSDGFRKVSERLLCEGYPARLMESEFLDPTGERIIRQVVRHPGAVAVVAIEGEKVVLVRQFRPALGEETLEVPAGTLDVPGELLVDAVHRELMEETGLDAQQLEELVVFHNAVGYCDGVTTVFLAGELKEAKMTATSVEEQYLEVEWVELDKVSALIANGLITDAKTVIGVLTAFRRLGL